MEFNIGDEITVNATIAEIEYVTGVPVLCAKVKSGFTILITDKDVNTIHPHQKPVEGDKRKGN